MKNSTFVSYYVKKIIFHKGQKRYEKLRLIRFSVLIIILMIPLILSMVFADGMIEGITLKYILLQNGHIQIFHNEPIDKSILSNTPLKDAIYSIDYVMQGNGIIYHGDSNQEVLFKGIDDSYFNSLRKDEFTLTLDEKLNDNTTRNPKIIISSVLASSLGASIGENVAIITLPSQHKIKIRPSLAQVVGIYESGYQKIDEAIVFVDVAHAATLFPFSGINEVIVTPENFDHAREIAEEMMNVLSLENSSYAIYSDFNQDVYQNFNTSRQVILFVFFVILCISSLYIASIAHEIVEDSKQSIAMLKILGASNGQLISSFFISILLITIVSIIIGVVSGIILSSNFTYLLGLLQKSTFSGLNFYLLNFKVTIPYADIFFICISFVTISTIFVLLTLRRIIKISVLEVLQQD